MTMFCPFHYRQTDKEGWCRECNGIPRTETLEDLEGKFQALAQNATGVTGYKILADRISRDAVARFKSEKPSKAMVEAAAREFKRLTHMGLSRENNGKDATNYIIERVLLAAEKARNNEVKE